MTIKTIAVPGLEAPKALDEHRKKWVAGGEFPFLIGSAEDVAELEGMCEPPADGGAEILAQAKVFDVAAWLADSKPAGGKTWPKTPLPPQKTLKTLFDLSSGTRKPEIHIGLVPVEAPEDIFARLGYGGWNACPPAHVHVAMFRYWWANRFASAVAISGSVVEFHVGKPPETRPDALALAREHYAYCPDIVEQGAGTVSKLGSGLLGAKFWYFWWD